MGVAYLAIGFLDIGEHSVGAVDDPHRLTAPGNGLHVAGLEITDIDFDRGTCCLGLFRWCKRTNKGYDSGNASYATCYGRRYQPGTAAAVDAFIFLVALYSTSELDFSFTSLLPPLVCANEPAFAGPDCQKPCEPLDKWLSRTDQNFSHLLLSALCVIRSFICPGFNSNGIRIDKHVPISNDSDRCLPTA